jgi:hypothetical protein
MSFTIGDLIIAQSGYKIRIAVRWDAIFRWTSRQHLSPVLNRGLAKINLRPFVCQNSSDPTAATGAQSATKQENQKLRISYLPYNVHPKRTDRLPPEQMLYRTLKINKKGAHLPARPFSYLNTNVPTAPNILFDNSDRLHYVRQTNHRSVWT